MNLLDFYDDDDYGGGDNGYLVLGISDILQGFNPFIFWFGLFLQLSSFVGLTTYQYVPANLCSGLTVFHIFFSHTLRQDYTTSVLAARDERVKFSDPC